MYEYNEMGKNDHLPFFSSNQITQFPMWRANIFKIIFNLVIPSAFGCVEVCMYVYVWMGKVVNDLKNRLISGDHLVFWIIITTTSTYPPHRPASQKKKKKE